MRISSLAAAIFELLALVWSFSILTSYWHLIASLYPENMGAAIGILLISCLEVELIISEI